MTGFIELIKHYMYDGIETPPNFLMQAGLFESIYGNMIPITNASLLEELDKLKKPDTRAESKFNRLFNVYYSNNFALAQKTIDKFKQECLAARDPEEQREVIVKLEWEFSRNPLLFDIFINQIEDGRNGYNVESWLVKLDFDNPEGKPGINRTAMTGEIKKRNKWFRDLGATIFNEVKARDPGEVFSDPYAETSATQDAKAKGMNAQTIEIGYGSYIQDPTGLKSVVFVRWQPGMYTIEDLTTKAPAGFPKMFFAGGTKLLTDVFAYIEPPPNGKMVSATKLFNGLGRNFAIMLLQADRDGIGKRGQNKGAVVVGDKLEFFGFDFGKAYDEKSCILKDQDSLDDAFNFVQPSTDPQKALVNYHMFMDTLYSDRLYGVQIMYFQRLRYQLSNLVDKLSPESVELASKLELITKALLSHPGVTVDTLTELQLDPNFAFRQQIQISEKLLAETTNKDTQKNIRATITQLNDTMAMSSRNLDNMFAIFSKRLTLTSTQANAISSLEALVALPFTTIMSENGQVNLNHPYVEKKYRVNMQFALNAEGEPILENGEYIILMSTVDFTDPIACQNIERNINKFNAACNLQPEHQIKFTRNGLTVPPAALHNLVATSFNDYIRQQTKFSIHIEGDVAQSSPQPKGLLASAARLFSLSTTPKSTDVRSITPGSLASSKSVPNLTAQPRPPAEPPPTHLLVKSKRAVTPTPPKEPPPAHLLSTINVTSEHAKPPLERPRSRSLPDVLQRENPAAGPLFEKHKRSPSSDSSQDSDSSKRPTPKDR